VAEDLTIEILRGIQATLVGLRADTNDRFERLEGRVDQTNVALAKLHENDQITNATLGLISERLAFAEAAASAATGARVRLDDRVDRLEVRVEVRVERLEEDREG
jgi:hypothetical protein